MISAMRFSKPSWRILEKGRLSGSAQTRSSPESEPEVAPKVALDAQKSSAAIISSDSRKRKDIQHAPGRCVFRKVLHDTGKSQSRGGVARIQAAGDNGSRPSSNS